MEDQQLQSPVAFATEAEYAANSDNYQQNYLLLLVLVDENGCEFKDFMGINGRRECYDYLKKHLLNRVLDPMQTKLLIKGGTLGKHEICAARFIRHMKNAYFVDDNDWDIDDFIDFSELSDNTEDDLIQYNE